MKRVVMLSSLVLLMLLTACGNQNGQSTRMKAQSQQPIMKERMHVSSIDTNVPVNKYHVKSNESIADIAEQFHLNLDDLLNANPDLKKQIGVGTGGGTGNPSASKQVEVPKDTVDDPLKKDQTVTLPANESMTGYEQQVLTLTNQERQKEGLAPYSGDNSSLNRCARAKSEDMATNNYFSHDSPTYGDPFAMMRSFGVQYQSAGENIAKGQPTPEEVVKAWMNSPGHRKNIMSGDFTHMGVGYVLKNGAAHWTQEFIGTK
ncbi:CAP domain-containing protein [Cohnella sp. WQ 127256]|uniref:CAP domain-containing protein n=1 Tax=Cohnella sp. WQ 127256 TaxID=2938790 RepID=UPI002117E8E5|nr:CAP domain-containing protein [Cohnella sp. WQ 127256]